MSDRKTIDRDRPDRPTEKPQSGTPPGRDATPARRPIARMPMFGWYDPVEIVKTGIRVGVASVFGEFFDRRELMAKGSGTSQLITHSYQQDGPLDADGGLWLDFTADTGDGFWPVHAVGRLMARETLTVGDLKLPRARAVLFGGDQVYPTASREAYRVRLNVPFLEANRVETGRATLDGHHIYAVPGNHDWYDGLTAFMGLFCARTDDGDFGRDVCGRHTKQHRSYFTLALPGHWWLIGADIQLSGYVDRGQIDYLGSVAKALPEGANLILMTAQPSWCNVGIDGPAEDVFRNYAFLEGVVTGAIDVDTFQQADKPRHALRVVMTGDNHHYAHYVERGAKTPRWQPGAARDDVRHYFTCGLGGSFLHPTHHLDPQGTRFDWPFAAPPPVIPHKPSRERAFDLAAVWPPAPDSRALTWRNLFFGLINWRFSAAVGLLAGIAAWTLAGLMVATGPDITQQIRPDTSWDRAVGQLFWEILTYPWGLIFMGLLTLALTKFSMIARPWLAWLVGVVHGALHVAAFGAIVVTAARYMPYGEVPVVLGLATAAGQMVVSTLIFGLYLLVSLNGFGRHWNEAFSSLKIGDYKGFLRLHAAQDGTLTIYPIVFEKVPTTARGAIHPKLAEAPVVVKGAPAKPVET
jgi:hypothetical protein